MGRVLNRGAEVIGECRANAIEDIPNRLARPITNRTGVGEIFLQWQTCETQVKIGGRSQRVEDRLVIQISTTPAASLRIDLAACGVAQSGISNFDFSRV